MEDNVKAALFALTVATLEILGLTHQKELNLEIELYCAGSGIRLNIQSSPIRVEETGSPTRVEETSTLQNQEESLYEN